MPSQSLNILEYTRPHGNEQPLTEDAIPSFLKAFTYEFVSPTPTPRICSHKTTNETVQYKTEGPNRGRTLVNCLDSTCPHRLQYTSAPLPASDIQLLEQYADLLEQQVVLDGAFIELEAQLRGRFQPTAHSHSSRGPKMVASLKSPIRRTSKTPSPSRIKREKGEVEVLMFLEDDEKSVDTTMDAANKSKICRFFEAFEIKPNNSIAFLHPDKMRWAISRVSGLTRQDFLPASSPIICAKYGVTKIKHHATLPPLQWSVRSQSSSLPSPSGPSQSTTNKRQRQGSVFDDLNTQPSKKVKTFQDVPEAEIIELLDSSDEN
ncbi:hypothetical protein NLI96_g594 [Meripilus lineatus]|uniref:Uncharacterized protein n=1 Tax=Meripilus lineatus TaxID=2056292 RepID=A0AAD5VEH2_9APHY|nr:hypothetical protein NLI96_g594 [Physisporinus lineatus]